MQKSIKLIVLIPEFLSQGVVEAQIFDFFDKLDRVAVTYIAVTKINSDKTNLHYINKYSDILYYIKRLTPDFIYIRSASQYWKVRFKTIRYKVKIIYSFRALVFVESFFKSKNYIKAALLFFAEFGAYLTAHILTTVTTKLKSQLRKYFMFRRECLVIPCYCATNFKKTPNTTDDIRMVYVGGSSVWQCTDEMFSLFVKLVGAVPRVSLTVYSKDVTFFNNKISKLPQDVQKQILVFNVSRNQLIKELPKYDIGFLLRRNSLVNRVASPIKFYEYVNAGVIPLITPYIGDISTDANVLTFSLMYDFNEHSLQSLINSLNDYICNRDLYRSNIANFERETDIILGISKFQSLLIK